MISLFSLFVLKVEFVFEKRVVRRALVSSCVFSFGFFLTSWKTKCPKSAFFFQNDFSKNSHLIKHLFTQGCLFFFKKERTTIRRRALVSIFSSLRRRRRLFFGAAVVVVAAALSIARTSGVVVTLSRHREACVLDQKIIKTFLFEKVQKLN